MLAAAAHAQNNTQPLSVLIHALLKLWPLWVLVGLVAIGKEALSRPQPRRAVRQSRTRTRRRRTDGSPPPSSPSTGPAGSPPRPKRPGGLSEIDAMTGTQFERRLESLFRDLGYAVRHTGRLGDFGADLVIERNGHKTAVQAKRHREQVGLPAVREALGAKGIYGCGSAMVVTNSTFTWRAKKLADANGVELWDRFRLASLLDEARADGAPVEPAVAPTAHCARCGVAVSARVRDYCDGHRDRFAGLIYCFEHQKQFPATS